MRRTFSASLLSLLVAIALLAGGGNASYAEEPTEPEYAPSDVEGNQMSVQEKTVEYDPVTGKPYISYGPEVSYPQGTEYGSGGSSLASGCKTMTLNNRRYNYTHTTRLYTYTTWTRWCWNRSQKKIYDVSTGFEWDTGPGHIYWRGEIWEDNRFYDWASGYAPKSGYDHDRKGSFENCMMKYGCWGVSYPRNIIRSHSDGTWSWRTED